MGKMIGQYLKRFFKFLIYFALLVTALLAIVYFTTEHREGIRFFDLIDPSKQSRFFVFLVVLAAVYPFVGFIRRKIYSERPFSEDKDAVKGIFSKLDYVLISDREGLMVFRPRKAFVRFMRLYEDAVRVDYTGSPIVVSGLRKDTYRLSRAMEIYLQTPKEEL